MVGLLFSLEALIVQLVCRTGAQLRSIEDGILGKPRHTRIIQAILLVERCGNCARIGPILPILNPLTVWATILPHLDSPIRSTQTASDLQAQTSDSHSHTRRETHHVTIYLTLSPRAVGCSRNRRLRVPCSPLASSLASAAPFPSTIHHHQPSRYFRLTNQQVSTQCHTWNYVSAHTGLRVRRYLLIST